MGFNDSVTMAQITDGASNTILLAELRAGLIGFDSRGVWAKGDLGSTMWAAGSLFYDAIGPNPPNDNSDNVIGCDAIKVARPQHVAARENGLL